MAVRLSDLAVVIWRARLAATRRSVRGDQSIVLLAKICAGLAAVAAGLWLAATVPLDEAATWTQAIGALWASCWLLVPLLSGGGNEAVAPEHLAYYPHSPARLARALLVSHLVSGSTALVVLGSAPTLVLGARLGAAALPVGVVAFMLQALVVLLASRTLLAWLSAFLRRRHRRLLSGGVLVVAGLGTAFGARVVAESIRQPHTLLRSALPGDVLGVLPTSWPMRLVTWSAQRAWPYVLVLAAALIALAFVLAAVLVRLTADRIAHPVREASVRPGTAPARLWRLLPDTAACAVARVELLLWLRDPRKRVSLALTAVFLPAVIGPALGGWTALLPFAGTAMVVHACAETANLYGLEPRTLVSTLTIPGGVRADVTGKQLAWLALAGPFSLTSTIVGIVVDRDGTRALWALGLFPAVLGVTGGLLVVLSAYGPARLPENADANPFTTNLNPHQARLAFTPLLLTALCPTAALMSAGEIWDVSVVTWLSVPTGLVTGAVALLIGRRTAIRRLAGHGERVLAAVT